MAQTTPVRILAADDQVDILDALRMLLTDEGYEVTTARSPAKHSNASKVPSSTLRSWTSITPATPHLGRKAST